MHSCLQYGVLSPTWTCHNSDYKVLSILGHFSILQKSYPSLVKKSTFHTNFIILFWTVITQLWVIQFRMVFWNTLFGYISYMTSLYSQLSCNLRRRRRPCVNFICHTMCNALLLLVSLRIYIRSLLYCAIADDNSALKVIKCAMLPRKILMYLNCFVVTEFA